MTNPHCCDGSDWQLVLDFREAATQTTQMRAWVGLRDDSWVRSLRCGKVGGRGEGRESGEGVGCMGVRGFYSDILSEECTLER